MTSDLERGVVHESFVGWLRFDADNGVTVQRADSATSLVVPGLANSDWARIHEADSWFCLVPERGSEIIVYNGDDGGEMSVAGRIVRLKLGASDPGGMHTVNFYTINEDEALVETELAVARLSRLSGLVWVTEHAEYTT